MATQKTMSQEQKEQILLSQLINNEKLFLKGITFLKRDFFISPINADIIEFINEYYKKYQKIPLPQIVLMEVSEDHEIDEDYLDIKEEWIDAYLEDTLNNFIQNMSMRLAIEKSIEHLGKENYAAIETEVKEAVNVDMSIESGTTITSNKDTFNDLFDIITSKENTLPTGWAHADKLLEGGTNIPSLNYIFAKSGGGKSVGLLNLSKNYTTQGKDVLYISLELNEAKILKRYLSHSSKIPMYELETSKSELYNHLQASEKRGDGKFTVHFFQPNTLNAKKLELFIKNYINVHGSVPILIVDYAGLMIPNSNNWQGMFERDKYVSEELRGIATLFNTVCWTADQFNRCVAFGEEVETPEGPKKIEYIKPGDLVLGSNNEYRSVLATTEPEEQEIYEITLKSGKTIKVSGRHIFPKVLEDGSIIDDCINTSLKVGDILMSMENR